VMPVTATLRRRKRSLRSQIIVKFSGFTHSETKKEELAIANYCKIFGIK
jgi:hypothetical protein